MRSELREAASSEQWPSGCSSKVLLQTTIVYLHNAILSRVIGFSSQPFLRKSRKWSPLLVSYCTI